MTPSRYFKPNFLILIASLAAASFGLSACDHSAETEITQYRFCAKVTEMYLGYSDDEEKPINVTMDFYNRSLFNTGSGINLSNTIFNAKVVNGEYCTPTITLPKALPADFFRATNSVYSAWSRSVYGCVTSAKRTFQTEVDGDTLTEIGYFSIRHHSNPADKENYRLGEFACDEDPATSPALQNWPVSAIPAASSIATPLAQTPTDKLSCIGNACMGRSVMNRSADNQTYLIGRVTNLTTSGQISFQEKTLFDPSGAGSIYATMDSPWWTVNHGSTSLTSWDGCIYQTSSGNSDGQNCASTVASKTPASLTVAADNTRVMAQVSCIGTVCEGSTAKFRDSSDSIHVVSLFGDYFTGYVFGAKTTSSAEGKPSVVVGMIPLEEIDVQTSAKSNSDSTTPRTPPTGALTAGNTALSVPRKQDYDTVYLISEIYSVAATGSTTLIPAFQYVYTEGTGASEYAISSSSVDLFANQDWGLTKQNLSACADTNPNYLEFCNATFNAPSTTLLPETSCIDKVCENQTIWLKGSSKRPGMTAKIIALYGTVAQGYALMIASTNQNMAVIWSMSDVLSALNTSTASSASQNPPALQASVGQSVVYNWNNSGQTSSVLGEVKSVNPDGTLNCSVDWASGPNSNWSEPHFNLGYSSPFWNLVDWGGKPNGSKYTDFLRLISDYQYDGTLHGVTDYRIESPCIGNICEGHQLISGTSESPKKYTVLNLFGTSIQGTALVVTSEDDATQFTFMNMPSLLGLSPKDFPIQSK